MRERYYQNAIASLMRAANATDPLAIADFIAAALRYARLAGDLQCRTPDVAGDLAVARLALSEEAL